MYRPFLDLRYFWLYCFSSILIMVACFFAAAKLRCRSGQNGAVELSFYQWTYPLWLPRPSSCRLPALRRWVIWSDPQAFLWPKISTRRRSRWAAPAVTVTTCCYGYSSCSVLSWLESGRESGRTYGGLWRFVTLLSHNLLMGILLKLWLLRSIKAVSLLIKYGFRT